MLPGPTVSGPAGRGLNGFGTSGTLGSPLLQFVIPNDPEPPHS